MDLASKLSRFCGGGTAATETKLIDVLHFRSQQLRDSSTGRCLSNATALNVTTSGAGTVALRLSNCSNAQARHALGTDSVHCSRGHQW